MTIEDFDKTKWSGGMQAIFEGSVYDVAGVDFVTCHICLGCEMGSFWASYEKVEIQR